MQEEASVDIIQSYHAHVYFNETTAPLAESIAQTVAKRFGLKIGTMVLRPVGPHPMWSCLIYVPVESFSEVIPWLAINRQGLTFFIHPCTDDELVDHRDRAIWLGSTEALDLSVFE